MNIGFLVPVTLCASLSCQAGEYFFEPVFNSNERYESNLFMRQEPLQGNWISTLSPGVNFGLRHDNGELKSNFTWNQLFYNNQSDLNIDEQLFNLNYQHTNERLQWSLGGAYNNQSSLNTEANTTGLLFTQVMRKQLSLEPSITYSLDELNSLSLNYSYNKATYEKNQNNIFLSDYDSHQVSAIFNHLYTEHDQLNAALSSSLYKTQIQNQTTYNHVAQLGWQHSFSQQLVAYVSTGINYSQSKSQSTVAQLPIGFTQQGIPVFFDPVTGSPTLQQQFETISTQRSNFGQVYSASIQKSFETASVSLAGSQNQMPTSQGLQTQTQLSINTAYTINERWTSGLSTGYTKSEVTGQQNSQFNRTYYSVSPNINWKWTPEINLGLSYTYRQQEFQGSAQPSLGNTVQLQFSYQPQINHQVK